MNKAVVAFLGSSMLLAASSIRAADFPVTGSGASGHPGDRVYIELTYNYGASFSAIAEDLNLQYQAAGLSMVAADSTINILGNQTLAQYATSLQIFAQAHSGGVLVNLNPTLGAGLKGYALSFYAADGTGHDRSGTVHLKVAFDILNTATPGSNYTVSFANSVLVNMAGDEFPYPAALQNLKLNVAAVPEPAAAYLMLAGLAWVGVKARRRPDAPFSADGSVSR